MANRLPRWPPQPAGASRGPGPYAPAMRSPARLILVPLLALSLAGCDAGNRAAPGSDNALGAPSVTLSTPYEGQTVVRSRQGAPVLAKFDLTGVLGRGAGSTLRYRLEQGTLRGKPLTLIEWTSVTDPSVAVALGDLKASLPGERYTLTAELLDKAGVPWTRVETIGEGAAATRRALHPQATVVRTFKVADAWQ